MARINKCRFCEGWSATLLKYGVRHYAHFECYLNNGKTLSDLRPWQVGMFPYRLLKERGLIEEAKQIWEAEQERQKEREQQRAERIRKNVLIGMGCESCSRI